MQKIDDKILFFINNKLNNKYLEDFMKLCTFAGNFCLVWLVYCLYAFFTGDKVLTKDLIIIMLLVNAVNNGLIKAIARRKRPFEDHPEIKIHIEDPYGSSFPSGHSANGFACAVIIFNFYPNFGFVAYVIATLIALSRMYLKVHYFSDVLCGCIVGILTASLYLMYF